MVQIFTSFATIFIVALTTLVSAQQKRPVARCYIANPSWDVKGCNGHRKYMSSSVSSHYTTIDYCLDDQFKSGNGQMWLMSVSDDLTLDNESAKERFDILMGEDYKNCIVPGSDTWCRTEGADQVHCTHTGH